MSLSFDFFFYEQTSDFFVITNFPGVEKVIPHVRKKFTSISLDLLTYYTEIHG